MRFGEHMARNLAATLLAQAWSETALDAALLRVLGEKRKRARLKLLKSLISEFAASYPPSPRRLAAFLLRSDYFEKAREDDIAASVSLAPPAFAPSPRFAALEIPHLATTAELAGWLDLSPEELDWFSNARGMQAGATAKLRHYDYCFVAKANGAPRLLEAPKSRLKDIQRRILRGVLDLVPVHAAAQGFVAGRSCVGAANRHAGETVVVTLDLKDFFLTTPIGRVYALYRSLGYPHAVAACLTRLCGATTPRSVFEALPTERKIALETRKRFECLHLPQGAPTSPALANLVAFRLDTRLAGLARRYDAAFSRYADDLAFSGGEDFLKRSSRLVAAVGAIVADEGYALNPLKTRIMPRSTRQRVTGIVVNDHLNVARESFDCLKATLHNCAKNGPRAENRDGAGDFRAQLDGRVLWVERLNPRRGARLRELFDRVDWTA